MPRLPILAYPSLSVPWFVQWAEVVEKARAGRDPSNRNTIHKFMRFSQTQREAYDRFTEVGDKAVVNE